jgi:NADH-quinone oxidoreductase subunit H
MFTAITTIGSFGVILAGWGSFSRYAMMGALRAIAQLISYEVVFLLTVSPIAIYTSSFSFFSIVENQINGY